MVVVQAVGRVDPDGSRYLLGDSLGNLHMLVLSHDSQRVVGLKLEALGRISAPSTLSYLDSGVVFVVRCLICSCALLTHSHCNLMCLCTLRLSFTLAVSGRVKLVLFHSTYSIWDFVRGE